MNGSCKMVSLVIKLSEASSMSIRTNEFVVNSVYWSHGSENIKSIKSTNQSSSVN